MKNDFIPTWNGKIDSIRENLGSIKGRQPGIFFLHISRKNFTDKGRF